ncbi:MAG: hypothetical protein ACJ8H8_27285 [Geminicoccaceae bacterium]
MAGKFLMTGAVAALALLAGQAKAITYGTPDCADNATNTGCAHPNTVSLSGFRRDGNGLLSSIRCTGSLLRNEAD